MGFLLIWLALPIVLGIVAICQLVKIRKLEDENNSLRMDISRLMNGEKAAAPKAEPKAQYNAPTYQYQAPPQQEKSVSVPDASAANAAAQPYQPPVYDYANVQSVQPSAENKPQSRVPYDNYNYAQQAAPQYTAPKQAAQPKDAQPIPPQYSAAGESDKGSSAANVILILGAMFITLAGFVFAAAAWGTLNSFFKSAVLLSFSALFFGVHSFAKRKLELESTSKAFYILGSVFLPASTAAAGLLNVFGEYFSFTGGGKMLLFALMGAMLSVCFFKAAHDYSGKLFARTAYLSLSAAVTFVSLYISGETKLAPVLLGIYTFVMLIAEPLARKITGDGVIGSEYRFFTDANTWVLAVLSLFLGSSVTAIASAVLFSASFFTGAVKGRNTTAAASAFSVYLLIGVFIGVSPDSADAWILTAAVLMIVYTILSMMDAVSESVRNIIGGMQKILSMLVIIGGMINAVINAGYNAFDISSVISAAMVLAQMIIISARRQDTYFKSLITAGYLWLCCEIASAFGNDIEQYMYVFIAAAMLVYHIAANKTALKKYLYTVFGDIAVCITMVVCMLNFGAAAADFSQTSAAVLIMVLWCMICACPLICSKENVFRLVFAPFAVFSVIYPIDCILCDMSSETGLMESLRVLSQSAALAISVYCVIAAAAAVIPKLRDYAVPMSIGAALQPFIYLLAVCAEESENIIFALFFIAAYAAVNFALKRNETNANVYGNAFYIALSFVMYELGRCSADDITAMIFPAALMIFLFGISMFPQLDGTLASRSLRSFLTPVLSVYGSVMLIAGADNGNTPVFAVAAAAVICGFAVSASGGHWKLSLASGAVLHAVSAFFFAEYVSIGAQQYLSFGMIILACLAGRFLLAKNERIDFLSISSFAGAVSLLFSHGKYASWLGMVGAALIVLNFIRRDKGMEHNRKFLAAAAVFLMPIWNMQPFVEIPEIIEVEFALLPIPVICALISRLYKDRSAADIISYVCAVVCALVLAIASGSDSDALDAWLSMVFAALFVLSFMRRQRDFGYNRKFLAGAAILLMRIWNMQPFVEIPEIIETEFALLPVPVICVIIKKLFADHEKGTDMISYIAAIICMISLFISAYGSGYAADAVILGAVILVMLICSFIRRQKRWFMLSAVSAAAEALVLTIELVDSSSWWVFLLIAGIILMAIGMTNELRRQKNKDKSGSGFMSDWRW